MGGPGLLYVTQVAPYGAEGEPRRPAGVHGVLAQSATAVSELAALHGLDARAVDDVSVLGAADLAAARVLALFTIGETPWSADQRRCLVEAVRSGRTAVLALHAASDSCYGWAEYGALVGARFAGHPWTQDFEVEVATPGHPAVAGLPDRFNWRDEVYLFRDLRPDAEILLRARPEGLEAVSPPPAVPAFGLPLAWAHREGAGRCFYTALGHFPAAWESPMFLDALSAALGWVLAG